MKKCPLCSTEYFNGSLKVCPADGTRLVRAGSVSAETSAMVRPAPNKNFSSKKNALIAGIAALAVFGVLSGGSYFLRWLGQPGPVSSVAVLPLTNQGDTDLGRLSDELTGTLNSRLSGIPALAVKPPESVAGYKGADTPPAKAAQELGVQGILHGRIAQNGEEIEVVLEMIDVRVQSPVWNRTYKRPKSEFETLRTEIAADVTERLRP